MTVTRGYKLGTSGALAATTDEKNFDPGGVTYSFNNLGTATVYIKSTAGVDTAVDYAIPASREFSTSSKFYYKCATGTADIRYIQIS